MLRIRPAPAPRTDIDLRTKRPPMAYIALLASSEEEFRDTVEEIEADPLFGELRAIGAVRRRGGRGRMPASAYEERLDREVATFVRKYRLDRLPGGLEQVQEALRKEGIQAVARRLGAPTAEVRRLARFLEAPAEPDAERTRARADSGLRPDIDDFVAADPAIDISDAIATVRNFVERHSLSQHQLVADFLHADDPPDAVARRYHTSEEVMRQVMGAVNFVLTADAATATQPTAARRTAKTEEPILTVARVYLREGEPCLSFGEDTGYGLRYVIDPGRLGELSAEEREEAEELLTLLRHINQRRSVQARVVAALFEKQRTYFASGDELHLVPVSQADLARELKEHQSTVSRSVRDRYIHTPYGTHELQYYCQRKRDVVLRLSAAHPELSDRELQAILTDDYGCRIARRTVAYHRRAHRR